MERTLAYRLSYQGQGIRAESFSGGKPNSAKYSRNLNDMKNFCEKALFQINEKMYAKEFEDDYDHIFCYGISFFKKRCMVGIK